MLVDVGLALPGVSKPNVRGVDGREVLDILGNLADLGLELVVNDKDGELGLGAELLALLLILDLGKLLINVLLELVDSVHESRARVVNLVDNQHAATEETAVVELVAELYS